MNENNDICPKYKIERSNKLNTLRPTGMTLTEVRFLAIYQSKINARDLNTKKVTFSLENFCNIMEINKMSITIMKNIINGLLCKPVFIPNEDGSDGFTGVLLFKKCMLHSLNDKWYVDIECSDEVLPYMFEMKKNYFTYELWNALKLKSVNQLRMYELLKQYEKIGERVILLTELKALLGIKNNQYSEYKIFKRDVILVCQKALEEHTDIEYNFEPIKSGRKIYALKFTITKNKNFKDDLKLKEFIKPEDLKDIQIDAVISSLYYRCKEEYTTKQLEQLYDYVSNCGINISSGIDNYIYSIYANIKISGNKINNLFKYTLSIIKNDINIHIFENSNNNNQYTSRSDESYITSYDINDVICNHKIEVCTQENLSKESMNLPIKHSKLEEVNSNINDSSVNEDDIHNYPTLEFKFFYDEHNSSFVSFESCHRLQVLLESKYHKNNTYWLLEEPFTQEQIINSIFEKHQIIITPKPLDDISDFEKILKSNDNL